MYGNPKLINHNQILRFWVLDFGWYWFGFENPKRSLGAHFFMTSHLITWVCKRKQGTPGVPPDSLPHRLSYQKLVLHPMNFDQLYIYNINSVCIYMCIYIYIHMYMYICIYVYICMYIHIHMPYDLIRHTYWSVSPPVRRVPSCPSRRAASRSAPSRRPTEGSWPRGWWNDGFTMVHQKRPRD